MAKQALAQARSLVTVATFSSTLEAQMGRAKLTAHGVRAFVSDEHLSTMNPQYLAAAGGVRLQVRQADAANAEELLRETGAEEEEGEDNPEDGPPCPRCGKRYAYLGFSPGLSFLAVLLLGIPFLFLKKRWSCGRCHHSFPPPAPGEQAHPYRAPRPAVRARR